MNITEALALSTELEAVSDSSRLDAEVLLGNALDKSKTFLYSHPEYCLQAAEKEQFLSDLNRRKAGEPVAYILGYREFWSLTFKVSPATLIPRPDTELLVETALALLPQDVSCQVTDLGTGTGAIALALASERSNWQLTGIDNQPQAVALAQENQQRLGITNVNFLQGSWCEPLLENQLPLQDLILSNPPYIDPEDVHLNQGDVRFEPRSALVAEEQGMADIKQILLQAKDCLKPEGWVLLEHGYDQAQKVAECFAEQGYTEIQTWQDLAGQPRVTGGRLG